MTYYHRDQLGSTRMLTDATGNVVSRYTYDAYGHRLSMTNTPNGQASQTFTYGYNVHDSVSQLIDTNGNATSIISRHTSVGTRSRPPDSSAKRHSSTKPD